MAKETGGLINRAILLGDREGLGLGEAVGKMIWEEKLPYREVSLLGQCYRMKIPTTVHVAIGTDIIHMHAAGKQGVQGPLPNRQVHEHNTHEDAEQPFHRGLHSLYTLQGSDLIPLVALRVSTTIGTRRTTS